MPRTPYATRTYDTSQKGPRVPAGSPQYIVIHHAATVSFDAVIQLELGARQVSSTVIIKDGDVASMFDEAYRAWSLSSQYWDSVSLSSETCNETTAPGWTISEASYATLAKVVAEWCKRYSIPCDRTHIMGHREVYTRYGASYATACPGGIDLDRVVRDASAILSGAKPATPKGKKMAGKISSIRATADGKSNTDQLFWERADGSLTWIQSPADLGLLSRYAAASDNGSFDHFFPAEIERLNTVYLNPQAVIVTPAPVDYAALAKAIVATGGSTVDVNAIAKAVNDDAAARLQK